MHAYAAGGPALPTGMLPQEHVGWEHAHVVGHSMGAMIAFRLAADHPERIDSLTLISTTCGRFQSIPRSWRALWYALQVDLAALRMSSACMHALILAPVSSGC